MFALRFWYLRILDETLLIHFMLFFLKKKHFVEVWLRGEKLCISATQ